MNRQNQVLHLWKAVFLSAALFCNFLMFQGCSTASRQQATEGLPESNAGRPYGPPENRRQTESIPEVPVQGAEYGPRPPDGDAHAPMVPLALPRDVKRNVVVLIGPGLARVTAAVGVLDTLEKAGMNIVAVAGIEMGGVVAATYGLRGLHGLEWVFSRWHQQSILDYPFIGLGRKRAKGLKLDEFIRGAVGGRNLSQCRLKCFLGVRDREHRPRLLSSVDSMPALSEGVKHRDVFDEADSNMYHAADPADLSSLLNLLKDLEMGTIVIVDLLSKGIGVPVSSKEEVALVDYYDRWKVALSKVNNEDVVLLPVDAQGKSFDDFKDRAQLIYAGKRAGKQAIESLRELWAKRAEEK